MDRFCTLIVVVGAIILVMMGCNEVSRMHLRDRSLNTCGMRAKVTDDKKSAKSARRSAQKKSTPPTPSSLETAFDSQVDDAATPSYKEQEQNGEELIKDFSDESTEEDADKFKKVSIDPSKALQSNNTRAINTETAMDEPTYSSRLGLMNPLLTLRNGCDGTKETVSFGSACAWFNGTDAYYDARFAAGSAECKDC